MIDAILSTDMAGHFSLVTKLEERLATHTEMTGMKIQPHPTKKKMLNRSQTVFKSGAIKRRATRLQRSSFFMDLHLDKSTKLSRDKREDRELLIDCITHASDLSNPMLPFSFAKRWADDVVQEFYSQSQQEKKLKM